MCGHSSRPLAQQKGVVAVVLPVLLRLGPSSTSISMEAIDDDDNDHNDVLAQSLLQSPV